MGQPVQRVVVVSAVNVRKGGTLTILRSVLDYLSKQEGLEVIALVHDRKLFSAHSIQYMEIPRTVKSWGFRLWCEYVTMHRISLDFKKKYGKPVDLWLSMHDTTPRVVASHREVYCHTSFPFMKRRPRDLWMDPKVFLFSLFTRFVYRINIKKNDSIIVQQEWFRDAMCRMLRVVPAEKFRVIPPRIVEPPVASATVHNPVPVFFYASTGDCHKNFETLFAAAALLEEELGEGAFKVSVTISGEENRYTRWLKRRWGACKSLDFTGFLSKEELFVRYRSADCFVFPSRIETWGLPITEYMSVSDGPLILADLPYAYETCKGGRVAEGRQVAYFPPEDAAELAHKMKEIYENIAVG